MALFQCFAGFLILLLGCLGDLVSRPIRRVTELGIGAIWG